MDCHVTSLRFLPPLTTCWARLPCPCPVPAVRARVQAASSMLEEPLGGGDGARSTELQPLLAE
jgi:hypothetical protein